MPATLCRVITRLAPAAALRVAAAAAAVAGSLVLGGCSSLSPVQTNINVQTADGVPVDLGAVQIRDLLVIASAKDGPGVVVGQVVNTGTGAATVRFSVDQASGGTGEVVRASVGPMASTALAAGATEITLPSVPASPGALVTLQVETAESGVTIVKVPVLPPQGYYASQTPGPSAS